MPGLNPLSLFRAGRPAATALRSSQWSTLRQQLQPLARRRGVQSVAETNVEAPKNESAFTKLWNSPVGPKTVHFWAPIMKWGLVIAGLADLSRPAETISLQQNAALMATGAIWTRWCFVIKPKNYFLATVNAFVFMVGGTQVTRIYLHNQSSQNKSLADELKSVAKDEKETAKGIVENPEGAVEKAKVTA